MKRREFIKLGATGALAFAAGLSELEEDTLDQRFLVNLLKLREDSLLRFTISLPGLLKQATSPSLTIT